jgi:uncharacterized protein YkwD
MPVGLVDETSQPTHLELNGYPIMHPIGRTSRRLFIMNAWAIAAVGCAGPPVRSGPSLQRDDRQPDPVRPITPEELEEMRAQIVEAHNKIREEAKLKKLTVNRKLMAAAQAHAEDMASRRKMTHTGGDGSSSSERVKARGYRYFRTGENVATGRFSVDKLMKGWMDSPAHKRNILGGYSEIGVGCAVDEDGKRYWCVTFGLPSSR